MPRSRESDLLAATKRLLEGNNVVCKSGAVASGPAQAARVGASILATGGDAMDAAAAAALACAVLEPKSVAIGGYVFSAVVRPAESDQVWSVDANAVAPQWAHAGMFKALPPRHANIGINEAEYECSVADDANAYGPRAVSVPGFIVGVGTLWERWGKLQGPEIVAPSEGLLGDGFPYVPTAAAIERRVEIRQRFGPTAQHLMPEGSLPQADSVWHRAGHETTLRRLSHHGWQEFYSGELGREVARYVQETGGILAAKNMANYTPMVEGAYSTTFRGNPVFGSLLPTGALSSLQILNMLDCFPPSVANDTAGYWHRLAEIMKLAWHDRLSYLADPHFESVPVERLLDKEYARGRAETLRLFPHSIDLLDTKAALPAPHGTIHVSATDHERNLVSSTISQGNPFGSCVTVPGTGIILGHGMCRFDPRPGQRNSIAGGKRPLSNVSPHIVTLPEREIAQGTRGGRPIINVSAQLAHRFMDGSASTSQILKAPRQTVCTREPVEFIEFEFTDNIPQNLVSDLTSMGHTVTRKHEQVEGAGAAHCLEIIKPEERVCASGNTWAAGVG
jgi:gamma-glutamyltranspeptidase / glutathione hydrolase